MSRSEARLSRRRILTGLLGLGVGALTGAGAWGYLYERHRLSLTTASLPVAGLPAALRGLRVVMLTDIHLSETVPADLVRESVKMANAARPDLIVLGGDYVSWADRSYVGPVAEALAGLTAPHGVYAILGNHDHEREMPVALRRNGYEVLLDTRTSIRVRQEPVDIIGLRFWTRSPSDLAQIARRTRGFPLLLAHDPRRLPDAVALRLPLVLSGHTHGGQVALPLIGQIATRKFPIAAGTLVEEGTTLFVSRGIGTVYVPLRVNCPPEVAVLTLTDRNAGPRPADLSA